METGFFKEGIITRRNLLKSAAAGSAVALGSRYGLGLAAAPDLLIAETEYGKLQGLYVDGAAMFAGIPYGASTAGAGRFMPPTKPGSWTGIRDATTPGPRALQSAPPLGPLGKDPVMRSINLYFTGGGPNMFETANDKMGEDCLVLNVCTPSLRGKRPVLVYLHGGGFASGDGILALSASRWVREEDVVVIGVNHRLNIFGYTYLGDLSPKYADSGNAGMLDLIAALEWIRGNIAAFGGDPANVTIFGQSGGGGKVSTLLAMPKAKGLFHRAIVESGSMLNVATKEEATQRAIELLKSVGLTEQQVDELQNLPAEKLLAADRPMGMPPGRGLGPQPVVDGRSIPQQTWTPAAPATAAGIAMIIGCCKDETASFALGRQALFNLDAAGLRDQEIKAGIPADMVDKLLALYHRDYPDDDPSDTFFRLASDRTARWNVLNQADRKLAGGVGSVYVYNFAWSTPVFDGKMRAFHTSELPMIFRRVEYPESEQLSRQICGAWSAFARSGNPNHAGLPNWAPYSTASRAAMIFDAGKTHLGIKPSQEELDILQKYPTGALL
jgi:para-nitrobenzyl esterase